MPDSPSNLGLYLKRGFLPVLPTFHLSKQLNGDTAGDVVLSSWSSADKTTQQKWLSELKEATNQIYPDLDYSKEITTTANFNLGETLILTSDDKAVGFSTVRISSIREGLSLNSASIQVMAIHPAFTNEENLLLLTDSATHLARMNNKQTLMLSVNACSSLALNQLLSAGFIVERMMIRMVLEGTDKEIPLTNRVNLSHWAG